MTSGSAADFERRAVSAAPPHSRRRDARNLDDSPGQWTTAFIGSSPVPMMRAALSTRPTIGPPRALPELAAILNVPTAARTSKSAAVDHAFAISSALRRAESSRIMPSETKYAPPAQKTSTDTGNPSTKLARRCIRRSSPASAEKFDNPSPHPCHSEEPYCALPRRDPGSDLPSCCSDTRRYELRGQQPSAKQRGTRGESSACTSACKSDGCANKLRTGIAVVVPSCVRISARKPEAKRHRAAHRADLTWNEPGDRGSLDPGRGQVCASPTGGRPHVGASSQTGASEPRRSDRAPRRRVVRQEAKSCL